MFIYPLLIPIKLTTLLLIKLHENLPYINKRHLLLVFNKVPMWKKFVPYPSSSLESNYFDIKYHPSFLGIKQCDVKCTGVGSFFSSGWGCWKLIRITVLGEGVSPSILRNIWKVEGSLDAIWCDINVQFLSFREGTPVLTFF